MRYLITAKLLPLGIVAAEGALLALSLVGSLYILTGLARRLTALGLRWSAGRPARRRLVAVADLACLTALTTFWTVQGQFRG